MPNTYYTLIALDCKNIREDFLSHSVSSLGVDKTINKVKVYSVQCGLKVSEWIQVKVSFAKVFTNYHTWCMYHLVWISGFILMT